MTSNIIVKSNVWIDKQSPDNKWPHAAAQHIPGDLMVEFLGTRDLRVLQTELTARQMEEYLAYRFFLYRGQSGLAFRDR